MSDKTISIIFPQGGIIPASIAGTKEDKHVDALAPISVPERYGRHLIDDRFAVVAPETLAEVAKAVTKPATKNGAAKKAVAEAEGNLAEAQALLAVSGEDLVARGEAETMVTEAEARVAALKV